MMRAALAAAVIVAASSAAPAQTPQAPQPAAPSGLVNAEALKPFFQRLAAPRTPDAAPVVVLQLGDSHSAADHISGGLRARLQAQFGEGGRGVLPAGRPFRLWSVRQAELSQSDGWRQEAQFLIPGLIEAAAASGDPADARIGPGPYGLSGFRLTSTRSGAHLGLAADPEGAFDQAVVCAMSGPGAGDLIVTAGDVSRRFSLAAKASEPVCRMLELPAPAARLDLVTDGGPVSLFSIAAFRRGGGASLSNLGVIGARIDEFAARDDRVLAAELAAYKPALILFAFGTNDGFQADLDPSAFRARFEGELKRLRRLAPEAAILVLGPPDADTSRPDIPLDGVHNLGFDCSELSPSETAGYASLVAAQSPQLARWYPAPNLAPVRRIERDAALAQGAAFWDWQARMGGACSAHRLAHAYPPLVRGDHIHFNSEGGDFVAGLLWRDLSEARLGLGGR